MPSVNYIGRRVDSLILLLLVSLLFSFGMSLLWTALRSASTATGHGHVRPSLSLRRNAKALQAPLSTVGRVINRLGLGRLKNLEPKKPVVRYQWKQPGDMIHVDTKQPRFDRVRHRITCDRRQGSSRGVGY